MLWPRIIAASLCVGGLAAAEEGERQKADEEILVTGSRIRRKDLTTAAPVAVISREQIEASGRITLGDYLQLLPAQGNGFNTQVNNGNDGTVAISLRALGAQRTLVLVNGRRTVPQNDLTTIPSAAVERVEVLLDGASAVYGSDAEAGVVNIITRKGFKGTEAAAYGGISQYGDALTYDLRVTTGQGGDRGSVLFSAGFYEQKPVWAGERDYTRYALRYDTRTGAVTHGGSDASLSGLFFFTRAQLAKPGSPLVAELARAFPGKDSFTYCFAETAGCVQGYRPFDFGGLPTDAKPGDLYNYQVQNYALTPSRRLAFYSLGEVSLGGRARGYYEASFVNRQSQQELAPLPLNTKGLAVSRLNAYNPFGVDVRLTKLRMVQFGNRLFDQDVDSFRAVGGIDGTLPDGMGPLGGLFWDASLLYGRVQQGGAVGGQFRTRKVQDAVGPSWRDEKGTPHCGADALRNIPDCTPLDLFHGADAVTADQVAGLKYAGLTRDVGQTTGLQGNVSVDLFSLFADRPAGLSAGYEYRFYFSAHEVDPIAQADESSAYYGKNTRGSYHVNEGYLEVSLPIVSGAFLADTLEATAAARAFDYSTSGTGTTYKLGGRWRPVRDLTVRGTWSTAFRAPQISDLYAGGSSGFFRGDPCAGPNLDPASPLGKACGPAINNGGQLAYQINFQGNPLLKPERARILTAGLVFEPQLLRNFSATLDYFSYSISDAISSGLDPSLILNLCYPSRAGVTPTFCDRIQRDPLTNQIAILDDRGANIGGVRTDGLDLALRYRLATPLGRFALGADGVWMHAFDVDQPDGSLVRARGTYDPAFDASSGSVYPALKLNLAATWELGGASLSVNSRYVGSYRECASAANQGIIRGDGSTCYLGRQFSRRVSASNTWDLQAGYALPSTLGTTTFSAGVNNLFNRPPPVVYASNLPDSDPTAYDFVGRFFYARIVHRYR